MPPGLCDEIDEILRRTGLCFCRLRSLAYACLDDADAAVPTSPQSPQGCWICPPTATATADSARLKIWAKAFFHIGPSLSSVSALVPGANTIQCSCQSRMQIPAAVPSSPASSLSSFPLPFPYFFLLPLSFLPLYPDCPPDLRPPGPPSRQNQKRERDNQDNQKTIAIDGELRVRTLTWCSLTRPLSRSPSRCRTPNARGKPNRISHTSTVAYITSQTKKVLTNTAKVGTPISLSEVSFNIPHRSSLPPALLLIGPVAWHWGLWQVNHPQSMYLGLFLVLPKH
jgi:hypothetical protein